MLENTVIIACSDCSNSNAFTTTTTDGSGETQCLEDIQIEAMPEPTPNLQAQ